MKSAKNAKERAYELGITVLDLVRDGKRDPEAVAHVLQAINDYKDFATFLGTKNKRGYVWYLGWRGIAVYVDWDDPCDVDKNLRSRVV